MKAMAWQETHVVLCVCEDLSLFEYLMLAVCEAFRGRIG